MRKDTYAGMALANIVFLFIIVTPRSSCTTTASPTSTRPRRRRGASAFRWQLGIALFTLASSESALLAVPV